MSNTYATPQRLCRYNANTFRFVYNGQIEIGQKLPIATTEKGEIVVAPVTEILEERPSMGIFKGERPTSYKVVVNR